MNKHLTFLLLFLAFSAGGLYSQVNYTFSVDVWQAFQRQQATIEHSPIDIGSTGAIFDGNAATLARSANINPMVVTLVFKYPVAVTSMNTLQTSGHGWWTVETANSTAELDNHAGAYQVLFQQSPLTMDVPAFKSVSVTARAFRLTMTRTTGDNYVHLHEWGITATTTRIITDLCFQPNQLKMIRNATFKPALRAVDNEGNIFPIASGATWSSSNPAVASAANAGIITSTNTIGETTLTASWNGISKNLPMKVVDDFSMAVAAQRNVKVALVFIDPVIPATGKRFSEQFWWYVGVPIEMAKQVRDSLTALSGGAATYQFVEIHDEPNLLTTFGSVELTVDSMYRLFLEPGWTTLHLVAEQLGQSVFHYNELLNKYDFCTKSNNHQIDEVWVYAMPFIGMGEAAMTGSGAFWINGPIIGGNSCTDLLPIMGFNYERTYDLALHNFGHRVETTMYKTFGTSVRYVDTDPPYPPGVEKNTLQKFMSYDKAEPGDAHIGNVHFPPNGIENYGYSNPASANTFEPNWQRYPFLFQQSRNINCSEWNCDHEGFMRWWLRRVPKFKCKDKDGYLNNWWAYVIDYNEAKAMEAQISDCDCQFFDDAQPPQPAFCQSYSLFPWEDWIAGVKVGTIDNPSGKSPYSDFSNLSTSLNTGATPIQLTTGFSYFTWDEYWKVWIDFNHDGVFSEPAEVAFSGVKTKPPFGTPTAVLNGTLSVPANAQGGLTRMRVAMKRDAYPSPCEILSFGEVEDYSVNIVPGQAQLPNLLITGYEIIPGSGPHCFTNPGQTFNILGGLVLNNGAVAAGAFGLKGFFSKDQQLSGDDVLWQSFQFAGAGPSNVVGWSFTNPVPAFLSPGVYYFIAQADPDHTVAESNEGDNLLILQVNIGAPDFAPSNVSGVPASANEGSNLNLAVEVTNLSAYPLHELTGSLTVNVYLSADNQFGIANDLLLGTAQIPYFLFSNSPSYLNGKNTVGIPVTIPGGTAAGNYFIFAEATGACEQLYNNNVSNPVPLQINAVNPGSYCTAFSSFPWEDWIERVKINDLDNGSGKSQYSDFTFKTANLQKGLQYVMSLTTGYSYLTYDEYWKVWIDFNHNGVFELDENVLSGVLQRPGNGTVNATLLQTVVIPTNVPSGTTRMRVSMTRDNFPGACGTLPFGEVEDYTVNIQPAPGGNLPNLFPSYSGVPLSGTAGQVLNGEFAVLNNGTAPVSGSYSVGWFFSWDNSLGPDDQLIGSATLGNTPIGVTPVIPVLVTVPAWATPGTYYLFFVVDKDNQVQELNEFDNLASSPFTVPGGGSTDYCASSGDFPWHEWISGVKVNDLEMLSGKSNYSDFTGTTFFLNKNSSTNSVRFTGTFSYFSYREYWKSWVDFNRNGVFEESERLFEGFDSNVPPNGLNATQSISGTVGPFPGASAGPTRMRVSMKRFTAPSPCEQIPFGEVEDYTVMIVDNFTGDSPQNRANDLSFEAAFDGRTVRLYAAFYFARPVVEVRFEKSEDGIGYAPLEVQKGKNLPDAGQAVQSLDELPGEGLNYYRLALTFDNGEVRYSPVRIVDFAAVGDFTIFPNPASGEIFIQPSKVAGQQVWIGIYDARGSLLYEKKVAEMGMAPHRIALTALPDGMYYLHLLPQGRKAVGRRFVVAK